MRCCVCGRKLVDAYDHDGSLYCAKHWEEAARPEERTFGHTMTEREEAAALEKFDRTRRKSIVADQEFWAAEERRLRQESIEESVREIERVRRRVKEAAALNESIRFGK